MKKTRNHLKIKLKSLAEEQRIIRSEERKARKIDLRVWKYYKGDAVYAPTWCASRGDNIDLYEACHRERSLNYHRINDVKPEIRASHIAYGLLRGLSYKQIEVGAKTEPKWKRVESIYKAFGGKDWDKLNFLT